MSTVKTGWLKNNNGEKFAPKTLTSQVLTDEGVTLESQLSVDLDATLAEAKAYTDTMTSGIASTGVVDNKINAHNTSESAHSDIRNLVNELSTKVNNFLDVDDATTDQLSEVLTLINNNKGTLDSITSSKVNVSDIVDNLTTSSETKVLSAKQGVALKALIDALQEVVNGKADTVHSHTISDVTNLQSTLNEKASKTSLDGHTGDTVAHISAGERTKWNEAKAHADSDHAPVEAQANVIESIKVNGTAQTITGKAVNITVPTNNNQLTNGAGYITSSAIANKADKATTLSGYGIADAYTKTEMDSALSKKSDSSHGHNAATTSANGFMTSAMVTKLNGITDNATRVIVDSSLSATSTNAIENKAVNSAIATATSAISANTNSIVALQEALAGIQEVTSAEIQTLFSK